MLILVIFFLMIRQPPSRTLTDTLLPYSSPVRSDGRAVCASHATEAALRSRLSEAAILRVMHVESRGRANAISPKGAMGCMQIMPATWRYLTGRHGLGDDPWDARFNMIGGALYLAEMARRFGFPGASDRKSVVAGTGVAVRVVPGGGRYLEKK